MLSSFEKLFRWSKNTTTRLKSTNKIFISTEISFQLKQTPNSMIFTLVPWMSLLLINGTCKAASSLLLIFYTSLSSKSVKYKFIFCFCYQWVKLFLQKKVLICWAFSKLLIVDFVRVLLGALSDIPKTAAVDINCPLVLLSSDLR